MEIEKYQDTEAYLVRSDDFPELRSRTLDSFNKLISLTREELLPIMFERDNFEVLFNLSCEFTHRFRMNDYEECPDVYRFVWSTNFDLRDEPYFEIEEVSDELKKSMILLEGNVADLCEIVVKAVSAAFGYETFEKIFRKKIGFSFEAWDYSPVGDAEIPYRCPPHTDNLHFDMHFASPPGLAEVTAAGYYQPINLEENEAIIMPGKKADLPAFKHVVAVPPKEYRFLRRQSFSIGI